MRLRYQMRLKPFGEDSGLQDQRLGIHQTIVGSLVSLWLSETSKRKNSPTKSTRPRVPIDIEQELVIVELFCRLMICKLDLFSGFPLGFRSRVLDADAAHKTHSISSQVPSASSH